MVQHQLAKAVFTQGDCKKGFQTGDLKTRLSTQLGPKTKSPADRKIPIGGRFHFGAKLNAQPGFEITLCKPALSLMGLYMGFFSSVKEQPNLACADVKLYFTCTHLAGWGDMLFLWYLAIAPKPYMARWVSAVTLVGLAVSTNI